MKVGLLTVLKEEVVILHLDYASIGAELRKTTIQSIECLNNGILMSLLSVRAGFGTLIHVLLPHEGFVSGVGCMIQIGTAREGILRRILAVVVRDFFVITVQVFALLCVPGVNFWAVTILIFSL